MEAMLAGRFHFMRADHWNSDEEITLEKVGGVIVHQEIESHSAQVAIDIDPSDVDKQAFLVVWRSNDGLVRARVGARSDAECHRILSELKESMPASQPEADVIPFSFWAMSPHGPQCYRRKLDVPSWEDITDNYTAEAAAHLDRLMGPKFRPSHGGQLLLWHGQPGTGKTFAIRAMASEWRKWCDFLYICDPDAFFAEAAYMMQVCLAEEDHVHDPDDEEEQEGRWRVLILEDTGELLTADAKSRVGQGLSRLLNLVDGLIGQGLRLLVLVTTNEEIKTLHPAVARPGRCASEIAFGPLNTIEARRVVASS